jgi:allophanate hydrolase subunit 1
MSSVIGNVGGGFTGFGATPAAIGSDLRITLTSDDTQPYALGVTSLTPRSIDLIAPPATFTIAGGGFVEKGFGAPVVNFLLGGLVLGQARSTALTGSTLTVPFPTNATSLIGPLPGLAAGAVQVQVYNQTGPSSYALVGTVTLTVADTRSCAACVTSITPNPIDLASAPASFTIAGQGFADNGFKLPVANFLLGGVVLGQARATALTGLTGSTLTVPFPSNGTSLIGPLPGLVVAVVQVQVYNQTGASNYALIGGAPLTVNDTRQCAFCVKELTPRSIDLIAPPAIFTVLGGGFVDKGFGPPVVNFTRAGVLVGQARANSLTGRTTLTVPFPTEVTSLKGPLPGLSVGGPVLVQVYNQMGPTSYVLVGSTPLIIHDSGPPAQVTRITPNSFDLANPLPTAFTIAGERLTDTGFGAPVVNLSRGGVLLGQARASSLVGSTTLTVPFPTNATSLKGPLPGILGGGAVLVQVYNQTGPSSYLLIGSITLSVTDSRTPQVTGITPSSMDLTTRPATFTIEGERFADNGFGRPVVNFLRNGALLGQARATSLVGSTTLTVPFPTNATSLSGPVPGVSAGTVLVQVYNQTGPGSYLLIGSLKLAVTDSRPPQVRFLNSNKVLICNPDCQPFTAQLTAQEGYTWLSFSGVHSDYQAVTTPTLSNSRVLAIGFGVTLSFPGTLPLARGQRYALVGTLDASNNLVLALVNEGPLGTATAEEMSVTEATLSGQRTSHGIIYFAPAEAAPARR